MSVTNWKEREREQRQNDILNVAETLFFSKGYDNVSMNSIATEAGLAKSTLYIYFNTKEELFYEIVLRGIKILNNTIQENTDKKTTGLKKLIAFKTAYKQYIKKHPEYFQAYNYFQSGRFDLTNILSNTDSEILLESKLYSIHIPSNFLNANETIKEIFKLREKIFFTLYNSIELCIEEGTINPRTDPLKVTTIQLLICENINNFPYDIEMILKGQGINHTKFTKDLDDFFTQLYIK